MRAAKPATPRQMPAATTASARARSFCGVVRSPAELADGLVVGGVRMRHTRDRSCHAPFVSPRPATRPRLLPIAQHRSATHEGRPVSKFDFVCLSTRAAHSLHRGARVDNLTKPRKPHPRTGLFCFAKGLFSADRAELGDGVGEVGCEAGLEGDERHHDRVPRRDLQVDLVTRKAQDVTRKA